MELIKPHQHPNQFLALDFEFIAPWLELEPKALVPMVIR